MSSLFPQAMSVIHNYLHLPFPDRDVSCPYYNNKRQRVRGALRVLIGKGSPNDIAQEATIISLRKKIDLKQLSSEQMKEFLINHNIGIDCSGLAYYILDAEVKARVKRPLKKYLHFNTTRNFFRKLLCRLRPVENTDARTFADNQNSVNVAWPDVKAGDVIIMLGTGPEHTMNHVLLVHEVDYNNDQLSTIKYTHTLQWSSDGKYHHGVRQGTIQIVDANKPLLEQEWTEQGKSGEENETRKHAKTAQKLEIRRLKILLK